jgi:hypothetical protein
MILGHRKKIDCCKVNVSPPPKLQSDCGADFCTYFPNECVPNIDDWSPFDSSTRRDMREHSNLTGHELLKRSPLATSRRLVIKWPSGNILRIDVEGQPSRGILFNGQRAMQVLNSFVHRVRPADCTDTSIIFQHIPDVRNLPDWTVNGETEHPIDVG